MMHLNEFPYAAFFKHWLHYKSGMRFIPQGSIKGTIDHGRINTDFKQVVTKIPQKIL